MKKTCLIILPLLTWISGCSLYHVQPLTSTTSFLSSVPHLVVKADSMPLPELAAHTFNPDDGLDMTEIAILAVVNNADLKAARYAHGVAQAQLMAAGVLPNPQLTAGLDHPTTSGPGLMNAFNFGISYDIGALIVRSSALGAARSGVDKIDWGILWQEWQVVQKSRLLFIQITGQEKIRELMQEYRKLLSERYQRSANALESGNLTMDAVSSNLAELQAVNTRLNELERKSNQNRHDLNSLVGVAPEVELPLTGDATISWMDSDKVAAAVRNLPKRRPDLLALQAAYQSQEQQFRQAVLAQFPSLNLGLTRARDTSGIYTSGFGVTMTLPVFDRNQGAIAVAKATRKQLFEEYQARIDDAVSEVAALAEQIRLTTQQQKAVSDALPELEKITKRAGEALDAGNMEFSSYTVLRSALFEKRIEELTLEQSVQEQQAVLRTLLGSEFQDSKKASDIRMEKEGKYP